MKAKKLFEKDASSLKDGGFIFQAIISHNLSFDIKDGYVVVAASTSYPFDKSKINATLHQVDLFPDLRTESGTATLTYVILSEVNTLARKFELAAEAVKRNLINPAVEVEREPVEDETPGPDDEIQGGGVLQLNPPPEDKTKVNVHIPNRPELEQGKTKTTIDITQKGETGNLSLGRGNSNLLTGGKTNPQLNSPKGNPALGQPEGRTPIPPLGESIQEAKQGKNKVTIFYKDEVERLEKEGRLTRSEIKRLNALFFKNTLYTVDLTTKDLHLREISTSGLDSGAPQIVLKISTSLQSEAFGKTVPTFENFKLVVSGLTSITVTGAEVANLEIFDPVEKKNDTIFRTILPSLILRFKTDVVPVETFSNKSSEIAANQGITYKDIFEFDEEREEVEGEDEEETPVQNTNKTTTKKPEEPEYTEFEEVKESISRRIASAEKQIMYSRGGIKHLEAQQKIYALKKKLENTQIAYSNLGESFYVKQELILLEKEISSFYHTFGLVH